MAEALRIGMVAGEKSGDYLGAGFMREMLERYPGARFEGIGGPEMESLGFKSLFPMDRLSVMGFIEPLSRLPELLRIDRQLRAHFLAAPPDVFVGIDSPGFNTRFELRLRQAGLRTVHYVSPSVWAYAESRIHKIRHAVDLMLVLFPFEAAIYEAHDIEVACTGHPLADLLDKDGDRQLGRKACGVSSTAGKVITLMPGSRMSEVRRLAPVFVEAAARCVGEYPDLHFLVPCATAEIRRALESLLADRRRDRFTLLDGSSRSAIEAADLVLLASGTASLETMLLNRPMIVCYRLAPVTYALASRMLKVPYIALPNLLAGERLVPEYIQGQATAENLTTALTRFLAGEDDWESRLARFRSMRAQLSRGASKRAVDAVLRLLDRDRPGSVDVGRA